MCPESGAIRRPASADVLRVRCFYDEHPALAGNLADVRVLGSAGLAALTDAAVEGEAALWSEGPESADASSVTRAWLAGENGRYRMESFGPAAPSSGAMPAARHAADSLDTLAAPIGFCGHGALAAAFVAFDRLEPAAAELEFANHRQTWLAHRCGGFPSVDPVALIFERPEVTACPVPEFAAACIGLQPAAAAVAGDDQGYLILQLDSVAEVAGLQPDFAALSAATRRALIVTAAEPSPARRSFAFRYFAPQYGPPEDAATGSAAVQLAAYWQPRLAAAELVARQLSAEGGSMRLAATPATVELRGRVAYGL